MKRLKLNKAFRLKDSIPHAIYTTYTTVAHIIKENARLKPLFLFVASYVCNEMFVCTRASNKKKVKHAILNNSHLQILVFCL